MFRFFLTLGLLAATPVSAQSAAQEARFFDAIKAIEARTYTFYVSVDPRFESLLAPVAKEQAFRDSQRCFLARIENDGGSDTLEEYIEAMEAQGETEITSLIDLANDMPAVLVSELVFAASSECGALSHSTQQMMTPEFIKLMDEPAVAQRLMGQ